MCLTPLAFAQDLGLQLTSLLPAAVDDGGSLDQDQDCAEAIAGESEDGWVFDVAPEGDLYPRYIADPKRSTLSLAQRRVTENDVAGGGNDRWALSIGQRINALRMYPTGHPEEAWQLDAEVGFFSEFDIDEQLDNLGWDGYYVFQLCRREPGGFAWRFGISHDSSHLGDELIEETGQKRVGYSREEVFISACVPVNASWRVYGDAALAYWLGDDSFMEPGRLQAGVECEPPPRWSNGHVGPYAAVDVSAFEEDDWQPNLNGNMGVAVRSGGPTSVWRFGFEFYHGRSQLGQFTQNEETHVAVGVWIEL